MVANTPSTKAILAGLLVVTAGFAGCASDASGDEVPTFASYADAKSADGKTFQPEDDNSSIELKLLYPSNTKVENGEHTIKFLLYDAEADEPVEGIEFEPQDSFNEDCSPRHGFCAEMPMMGHGTSPEESPEHVGDGVYEGMTNFSMDGEWDLNVRPQIDGEVVNFTLDFTAGDGEGGDGHDHQHEG
jgi:hypothetical protein